MGGEITDTLRILLGHSAGISSTHHLPALQVHVVAPESMRERLARDHRDRKTGRTCELAW